MPFACVYRNVFYIKIYWNEFCEAMIQNMDERQRFVALIRQYDPLLMRICSIYGDDVRNPSADLYQEIVCHLWKNRDELFAAEFPTSWIFQVAHRVVISQYRFWRVRHHFFVENSQLMQSVDAEALESVSLEDLRYLQDLISNLDDKDKCMMTLFLEGYNAEEIGEILRVSNSTVASRLSV